MKKIIITIVDGFHYRYLGETGVLKLLLTEVPEAIILTTPALLERVTKLTENSRTEVRLLEPVPLSLAKRLHLFFKESSNRNLSETVNQKNEIKKRQKLLVYLLGKVFRAISAIKPLYQLVDSLLSRSFRSSSYRSLIREFLPDLVVFSTPGQKLLDLPLIYECKIAGIKSIAPVYSWDNLSGKGPFVFDVDYLVVWNEIMKREALYYHGYRPECVDAVGVPVFDSYLQVLEEPAAMRSSFLVSLNLNPDLKTITVTTIPRIFFGSCHNEIIRRLVNFVECDKMPKVNILVRPHPKDDTDYGQWSNHPFCHVDYYGSPPDDSLVNWIPRDDNTIHLGRTMRYSDIVINIASTITIDAACFDTPVINIAYDMKDSDTEYFGSIARYYNYTHYQHVVKVGAASIVRDDQQFLDAIKMYLNDPGMHSDKRAALVRQQTGVLDGMAHKRIANCILNKLK